MKKRVVNMLGLAMGTLLVFSSLVMVQPVSGAVCRTSCSGGRSCTCSGTTCTQIDGSGCATYNSSGEETSACLCPES